MTETVVCIAILAILVALLFPAYQKVRGRMLNVRCINNLRVIYGAVRAHMMDANQYVPEGPAGAPLAWYVPLFDKGYLPRPRSVSIAPKEKTAPTLCPANPTPRTNPNSAWTNYAINGNLYTYHGPGIDNTPKRIGTISGTKLLMIDAWKRPDLTWYYTSSASYVDPVHHDAHVNALFLDGHVESPRVGTGKKDAAGNAGEVKASWYPIP